MTNETIKLAIETLKLALKADSNPILKKSLLEGVSRMFLDQTEKKNTSFLTSEEIRVGETEGKLACVKLVKDRTQMFLMDAKRLVETEFERLGKTFKVHSY